MDWRWAEVERDRRDERAREDMVGDPLQFRALYVVFCFDTIG